jgi:hypothetical protein
MSQMAVIDSDTKSIGSEFAAARENAFFAIGANGIHLCSSKRERGIERPDRTG